MKLAPSSLRPVPSSTPVDKATTPTHLTRPEPSGAQKFMNFSTEASSATATIEIDVEKLDPAKLFKRVVDGAIIYVANDPIAPEALRVRSGS